MSWAKEWEPSGSWRIRKANAFPHSGSSGSPFWPGATRGFFVTPAEFAGRFEEKKSNEKPLVQLV